MQDYVCCVYDMHLQLNTLNIYMKIFRLKVSPLHVVAAAAAAVAAVTIVAAKTN